MVNLMKTRNILFIVESKNDEPRFIEQLLSKCYPFHHLTKLLFIQSKKLSIPTIEDYDQLNYAKIFDIQYENLQNDYIWIVNTCIVILIDYNEKSVEVSCGFIRGRNRHYFLPSY